MKITIKTLKNETFPVEIDGSNTVLELKGKVHEAKPDFSPHLQKLIHTGRVLKDTDTVDASGIKEGAFLVIMISKESKPKPTPAPAAAPAPAPVAAVSPAPAPSSDSPVPSSVPDSSVPPLAPAATTPAPTVATTPAAPPPAPAPAPAGGATTPTPSASLASAAPAPNPEVVAQLTAMGFPEDQCIAALNAAQGNPDLAVNFLMEGIPPGAAAFAASGGMGGSPVAASPAAQAGAAAASISLDDFRNHPQFNQLRAVVQQNPASINQVLDLIGTQSPELLQVIHANHQAFMDMMNEPIEDTPAGAAGATPHAAAPVAPAGAAAGGMPAMGGGGSPNPMQLLQMLQMLPQEQRDAAAAQMGMTAEQLNELTQQMAQIPPEQMASMMGQMGGGGGGGGGADQGNVIRLSQEEMQAVGRLQELGFSQQQAAQAYLACDKNEAMAANLLFEGWGADDMEDGDAGGGGGGDDMYS